MVEKVAEPYVAPLGEIYGVHLNQLFIWIKTLVYGVFALTFAFYLAFFTETELRKGISDLSCLEYIGMVAIVSVGNLGWGFFCWRTAQRIQKVTDYIEQKFGQDMPGIMVETNLLQLYKYGSSTMVLVNWLGWVILVTWLTQHQPAAM